MTELSIWYANGGFQEELGHPSKARLFEAQGGRHASVAARKHDFETGLPAGARAHRVRAPDYPHGEIHG